MKRILLPASGAVLATGLLAAGLAGTAQAADDIATDPLASSSAPAYSVAKFWLDANGAALKKAKEFQYDAKEVTKLVSGGGYNPDGKAGSTTLPGSVKPTTSVVKNINLPKTIGKVFFTNTKGELNWCSATSIQSKYNNLVATAGHCVYDTAGNGNVLKNWVFVPGYYQGNAPWGVYVGKQAFTHYDFDNYEDYDRDYAFVTVYNGISLDSEKQVTKSEYDGYKGDKYTSSKEITAEEYAAGIDKYGPEGPFWKKLADPVNETVAQPADAAQKFNEYLKEDGYKGVKVAAVEVTEAAYNAAPGGFDNNSKFLTKTAKLPISQEEYKSLLAQKADGKFLGKLEATKDKNGNETAWFKTQYFTKKWVKSTVKELYFVDSYVIQFVKDRGTLASNVGAQGFSWNQKTGQATFVFGYPAAPHADGNKPYTGTTPKWCYSAKPSGKVYTAAAYKVEEHVAIKCAMTGGADGGPWLVKYSNTKRLGYVNGVTSLFGDQDQNGRVDYISSAYFDGETYSIYAKAANTWSGKIVGPKGEILK
ncbi:hypothetical protein Misp01_14130 [Microtetraspora sp. NBRC 13810]|uniref:hypothetical protein n=1 Tax=Microtetraspora sp. NBRC 13810 TaxID=3030990 RepID=UPI0024A5CAA6|nr:hypothetical protein [Microtetraspora sp. NBRC 13810]GLW06283.1 hypothetical protein Misp01_14130 [Microtetraspora sp. NBRC 13810]